MYPLISISEMQELEKKSFQDYYLNSSQIIEIIGLQCAIKAYKKFKKNSAFIFLIGKGNNGADGLCMAKHLFVLANFSLTIEVYLLFPPDSFSQELKIFLKQLQALGVFIFNGFPSLPLKNKNTIVVDAIFGTGYKGEIEDENLLNFFENLNKSKETILSLDIPSALHANDGLVAKYTWTMGLPKWDFFTPANRIKMGEIKVIYTSFPNCSPVRLKKIQRNSLGHKNTFGHAICFGGSIGLTGALSLCTTAMILQKVGLVSMATWKDAYSYALVHLKPQVMTNTIEEFLENKKSFQSYNVMAIGPGLSTIDKTQKLVHKALLEFAGPIILDADAINILHFNSSVDKEIFQSRKSDGRITILTPHVAEFIRLMQISKEEYYSNMQKYVLKLAQEWNVHLVVKSFATFYITPEGKSYVLDQPNSDKAVGGSGDRLTGIIAAQLAINHLALIDTMDIRKFVMRGIMIHSR